MKLLVYLLAKDNFTFIWWILDHSVSQSCLQHVEPAGTLHPPPGDLLIYFSCLAVICCVTVIVFLDEITTIILSSFFFSLFFFLTLIRKTAISFDSYKEFSLWRHNTRSDNQYFPGSPSHLHNILKMKLERLILYAVLRANRKLNENVNECCFVSPRCFCCPQFV